MIQNSIKRIQHSTKNSSKLLQHTLATKTTTKRLTQNSPKRKLMLSNFCFLKDENARLVTSLN